MAYVGNNLSALNQTIEGTFNTYIYFTNDSLATMTGANYISDGQKRGMELGNYVWAYNASNGAFNTFYVQSVQATTSGYGVTLAYVGPGTGQTLLNVNNTGTVGGTLTAASIASGLITRSGPTAAFTDTTDTATAIAAATATNQIGNAWNVRIVNTTQYTQTLSGGTGVTLSGITIVPPNSWIEMLVVYTAAATVTMYGYEIGTNVSLPYSQYKTAALQSAAIVGANMAGSAWCNFDNTGTTPGSLPTDTAANIIAAIPNAQIGFNYMLAIRNSSGSANTATITAGTGVTLTGTMTIAQTVTRLFNVSITGAATVTIQSMGILAAGA